MKELYIIRHGQTDYNKKGIVQGSGIDSSLNELGQAQAKVFYEKYKEVGFDSVYTSSLKRAIQSVSLFIEEKQVPHKKLTGLNEINWGVHEGNPITPEQNDYYQHMLNEWKNGNLEVAIEGGESPLQVQNRQKEALKHILEQVQEEKVLICMHGRAMRIFLCLMLNDDLAHMDNYKHQNLCLYKLIYKDSKFELLENCNIEHLNALTID